MRPSIRPLRRLVPRTKRAMAATLAVIVVPLVAVTSAAAMSSPHHRGARPHPAVAASYDPADIAIELAGLNDNLGDFDALDNKPAASPHLRTLPHVNLLHINVGGIPPVAAGAYMQAARVLRRTQPSCGVHWWLVAGIGYVESGHAHSGGSWRKGWDGVARPPILGPVLDGSGGFAAIRDTDHGAYDGNTRWDRAVGPMQFLPSTWRQWGTPVSGGPPGNPQNIVTAALATARYLCASGGDLTSAHGMAVAVFGYNHSFDYVRLVLSVAARYANMSPAALGVDQLPTDKQYRKHRRHLAQERTTAKRSKTSTSSSGGSTTTASQPTTSSSPKPSPSPTSNPVAVPSPSPSQTILPLPSGGGLP